MLQKLYQNMQKKKTFYMLSCTYSNPKSCSTHWTIIVYKDVMISFILQIARVKYRKTWVIHQYLCIVWILHWWSSLINVNCSLTILHLMMIKRRLGNARMNCFVLWLAYERPITFFLIMGSNFKVIPGWHDSNFKIITGVMIGRCCVLI